MSEGIPKNSSIVLYDDESPKGEWIGAQIEAPVDRASAPVQVQPGGALRISKLSGLDHEYYLTIPPEAKDWLLLNLLQE